MKIGNIELKSGFVNVLNVTSLDRIFYKNFSLNNFENINCYNKRIETYFDSLVILDLKVFIIDSFDFSTKMLNDNFFNDFMDDIYTEKGNMDLLVINGIFHLLDYKQRIILLDTIHKINKQNNITVFITNDEYSLFTIIFEKLNLINFNIELIGKYQNLINKIKDVELESTDDYELVSIDGFSKALRIGMINWYPKSVMNRFSFDSKEIRINSGNMNLEHDLENIDLVIIEDFSKMSLLSKIGNLINIVNLNKNFKKTLLLISNDFLLLNLCNLMNKMNFLGSQKDFDSINDSINQIDSIGTIFKRQSNTLNQSLREYLFNFNPNQITDKLENKDSEIIEYLNSKLFKDLETKNYIVGKE